VITALAFSVLGAAAPLKATPPPAPVAQPAAPKPATPPRQDVACTSDEFGFCTDKRLIVPLTGSDREVHLSINTALSDVLVIWLPPGVSVPKCRRPGKDEPVPCLDLGNPGAFQAEVQEIEGARHSAKITVRPFLNDAAKQALLQRAKADPGFSADDIIDGERGNLQFSIADRWTINLDLVVGPSEKAVRQILFSSPELEKDVDELGARCEARSKQEYRKLQDAWANLKTRATEETAAELAFSVLRSRRCRFSRWTEFRDQLWVQAESTCEIGNHRFIVFRIRNRAGGGDIFRPGEVSVGLGGGEDPKRIDSNVVFARENDPERRLALEDLELGKDDEVVGTVHFSTRDAPGNVVLRIVEAGGKGRQIDIKDIGF